MSSHNNPRRLPPGPSGVPILGSLPFWHGPETNMTWAKQYGDIYSVKMGPNLTIYLNSVELVKEYLVEKGDLFADRPKGPAAIANGLLFGSGEHWRLNKKLATRGFWRKDGDKRLQKIYQTEVEAMLPEIAKHAGKHVNLSTILRLGFTNAICSVLRGSRFDYDDPEFVSLLSVLANLDDVDLTACSTLISLAIPRLWSIFPHRTPDLHKISQKLQVFIRTWSKQSEGDVQMSKKSDALIDLFRSSEYTDLNSDDKEMVQSAMDMFNGGVTSSLSGLEFLFLYMIHHPEVQMKVQKEIDDVIGRDRTPSWEDKPRLPYTEATLLESSRLASVTPSSLPHVAVQDTEISGFQVSKGTVVSASLYCLHRDPRHYKDPEMFSPERHLDADGKVKKPESFMPMGVGPRLCVGCVMFPMSQFLIFTSILQRYSVHTPDGQSPPPFETRMRIVRRLVPYELVLTPRETDSSVNNKS